MFRLRSFPAISATRLQGAALTMAWVAVIAMLFWVSRIYVAQFDWTYLQRSTLSPSSQDVLASLEGPVEIQAFVHDTDVVGRRMIEVLIGRYQRYKEDIRLQIVNPDREPELVRELGISAPREMLVSYAGSSERLSQPTEDDLSHLLLRLARRGEQSIYFLTGHGERSITGVANFDLGDFGKALEEKGFRLQTLNLVSASTLPQTEGPWVVASPSANLQPHELELLSEFLAQGGNLLWVLDPNAAAGRQLLAEKLGVTVLDGTVVDAGSRLYGIDDPAFAVISEYPEHEITDGLDKVALFPRAAGFEVEAPEGWQVTPILRTQEQSWTELGEVAGRIRYDAGTSERPGPILIGALLSRSGPRNGEEQRVAVLGDGDFLSNSFLANGANLELGLRLVTWLSASDPRLAIEVQTAPDTQLEISRTQLASLAIWFLVAQPVLTLGLGIIVWWRRRRR